MQPDGEYLRRQPAAGEARRTASRCSSSTARSGRLEGNHRSVRTAVLDFSERKRPTAAAPSAKRKLLLKIIDPLTNPTAHGASASDAFDVIIPSMPGYGYSGKPRDTGWGPDRIARAWTELMKRLGYPPRSGPRASGR
jgi:hypothetical protein